MKDNIKVLAATLTVSGAAILGIIDSEGFSSHPYIPVKGDRPTIGYGSTFKPDGTPVTMQDKPITKSEGLDYLIAHNRKNEKPFRDSVSNLYLSQAEYDLYYDFVYQYGINTWNIGACNALLMYKRSQGRDCSLPENKRICGGVWTRQQGRHASCIEAQTL